MSADDSAARAASSTDVTVEDAATPKRAPNITVEVTITKDPKGLGLVIGLSKKSQSNPDKPQVVFIRALQRRSDGTQSQAVKDGQMMPQDVVEAVNDVDVGTELRVLTDEINKVPINGDIKFRLSRRQKDEDRRIKALADKQKARSLDVKLRTLFKLIDTSGDNALTIEELDAVGKDVFLDKLGVHLPADVVKGGFGALASLAEKGDGKISFEEFRGILYGPELAVASRKTRFAKYAVLFKTLDTDGSRSISKDEFMGANDLLKKLFGENTEALKAEFETIDANGDGKIMFTEFVNGAEEFYERHMHPDGYEAKSTWEDHTHDDAEALVDEHYDENHVSDSSPSEAITTLPSLLAMPTEGASAEGEEKQAEELTETEKAHAAAVAAAEADHAAAEAQKEEEEKERHKAELAAKKKRQEEAKAAKKAKAEADEAARAAKAEEEAAAAAPASGGCCVIA